MTQALHEFEVSPVALERLEVAATRLEEAGPEATLRWAVDVETCDPRVAYEGKMNPKKGPAPEF